MHPIVRSFVFTFGLTAVPLVAHAGDFNGDGRDDLAVSIRMPIPGSAEIGAIRVLYAAFGGLATSGSVLLIEPPLGDVGDPTGVDFGTAYAIGDFDNDGFDDLAVGAPEAPVGDVVRAGAVFVFRGGSQGLVFDRVLHQDVKSIADKCEFDERFGGALVAGKFDADNFVDLAVGVLETVGKKTRAGAVHVFRGSKAGLTGVKDRLWHQDSSGIKDKAEAGDEFGSTLAAGDVDGDGRDDLVIQVRREQRLHGDQSHFGAVAILRGGKKGLSANKNAIHDLSDLWGVPPDAQARFGDSLAVCDFDHDGDGDLLIGAPGTNGGNGLAFRIESTAGVFDATNNVSMGASGFGAASNGESLVVGDFNADGRQDFVVGSPFVTVGQVGGTGGTLGAGQFVVKYGGDGDISDSKLFTRATADVIGEPLTGAAFGFAMHVADFNGDFRDDLAVAAPFDTYLGYTLCGTMNVFYGSSTGLSAANGQHWYPGEFGTAASHQFLGLSFGN
ncbi:MAG: VCBS repeat-containing protein [Planctomycetes bacterium]|nr:VCBS repeat-containing protein [Planctomycetota bacterium]